MPELLHDAKHSVEKDLLWRVPGPNSQHHESLGRSVSDAAASWASNNAHVGQETPCIIPLKQALPSPKLIPGWFMNFHTYTCAGFSQDRRIRAANAPSIPCLCGKETKKPSVDTIEGGTKV
jgi:hypothetical protein